MLTNPYVMHALLLTNQCQRDARKTVADFLKISDSPEGASVGAGSTPVAEFAVLARPEEELTAPVVGMLVQGPVSLNDVAGVDVVVREALLDRLAVIGELHHVTLEFRALIDAHPIRTTTGL